MTSKTVVEHGSQPLSAQNIGAQNIGAQTINAPDRTALSGARRIVVKVGSSSLTSIKGGISEEALTGLADALAHKRNAGAEIILVSSGAIAAGLAPLGLEKRPRDLATQQAAASVGQGLLMARYTHAFGAHGVTVSQVLLTADDFMRRSQHTNAFRALDRLLNLGVVPVVNENDTVATHEIRFGDNDRLAALVAHLVRADALVLLSDVDSLYDGPPSHGAKRIPHVVRPPRPRRRLDRQHRKGRRGHGRHGHQGRSRQHRRWFGHPRPGNIHAPTRPPRWPARTWAHGSPSTARASRSGSCGWPTWHPCAARLVLDDGAVKAVRDRRTSLLPAGIAAVNGDFEAGDAVEMVSVDSTVIARGLVNYSAAELPQMLGRSTHELGKALGRGYDREVVHVDDLVLV